MTSKSSRFLATCIISVCLILEACTFISQAKTRILPTYPPGYDQSGYLTVTYLLVHRAMSNHWVQEISNSLKSPSPSGILFPVEGALMQNFLGTGRLSCLALGFTVFAIFQWALFSYFTQLAGLWLGIAALAFLLSLNSLFLPVGGIYDYRIDFLAASAFGIFICLLLKTEFFYRRGCTLLAAISGTFLVLNRFITLSYILPIFALATLMAAAPCFSGSRLRRLKNAALMIVGPACVIGPVLWNCRQAIWNYYFVGHVTGSEKRIRINEQHIHNWIEHLTYYPRSILSDHLGGLFPKLFLTFTLVIFLRFILRSLQARKLKWAATESRVDLRLLICGLACLVPIVILTLDQAKSPVVGSIVTGPAVMFFVLIFYKFYLKIPVDFRPSVRFKSILAVCLLVLSLIHVFLRARGQVPEIGTQRNILAFNDIYETIRLESIKSGWPNPRISSDRVADSLLPMNVLVYAYENHLSWIEPQSFLGRSIFSISSLEIIQELESSDFFISSELDESQSPFPFTLSMLDNKSLIAGWIRNHMRLVGTYQTHLGTTLLFMRPQRNATRQTSCNQTFPGTAR